MRAQTIILACLLLVTAFSAKTGTSDKAADAGVAQAAGAYRTVTPQEAARMIEAAPALTVLDVRTAEEYAQGHLPGAVNIDFYADDFRARLDALEKHAPVLVYCRSGNRSGQTVPVLGELGFADIRDMNAGWLGWQSAGLAR